MKISEVTLEQKATPGKSSHEEQESLLGGGGRKDPEVILGHQIKTHYREEN